MDKIDYAMILGVSPSASKEDVKSAYRQKCLTFHPDRNSDSAASEMFKRCTEAYNFLMNRKEPDKSASWKYAHSEKVNDIPTWDELMKGRRNRTQKKPKTEEWGKMTWTVSVGILLLKKFERVLEQLQDDLADDDSSASLTWSVTRTFLESQCKIVAEGKKSTLNNLKEAVESIHVVGA